MKEKIFTPQLKPLLALALRVLVVALFVAPLPGVAIGAWTKISNFPYYNIGNPGHMLLLPDGTVMVQQIQSTNWFALKPDKKGHYVNGNWSQLESMNDSREYYSSDVLQNGTVFVAGGEDGTGGKTAELFNPLANNGAGSWQYINPPASLFATNGNFEDSDSILLPDGTVLVTPVDVGADPTTLIYNPFVSAASAWSSTGGRLVWQDEATWVKLPDGSILTIDINEDKEDFYEDVNNNTAERFIPSLSNWIVESNTPVHVDGYEAETGGGFMMADGRAFFLCGSGHTLFYTPSGSTNLGSWQQGPDMPPLDTNEAPLIPFSTNSLGVVTYGYPRLTAEDTPAAMLPNGKILCQLARDGNADGPTSAHAKVWFYEFDPSIPGFVPAPCPTNTAPGTPYNTFAGMSDRTSMLDLPDGTVIYNDGGYIYIYQSDLSPLASGKPTVNSVGYNTDGSLHLTGTLFNGISQGASYGDDFQMDSNFPLVLFTDAGGNVYYGRTYNWSSTGVQTGSQIVTTECNVPANISNGPGVYSLQVVANGNASNPVTFYGPVWVDFNYTGGTQNGNFSTPYKTLAGGTNAVFSGGTIALNASLQPSASRETIKISKPMTIISVYGASTIGN